MKSSAVKSKKVDKPLFGANDEDVFDIDEIEGGAQKRKRKTVKKTVKKTK